MQFVVMAWDYTDDQALERRMAHREAHLAAVKQLIADGKFISGGAILDPESGERMIGSTLHLEFPDRESLEAHLHADPYISGKVWERIEIHPVRLVPLT